MKTPSATQRDASPELPGPQPTPRVSVVCPFFNEEPLICAAAQRMVENLEKQLDCEWELILVDDGSTDRSLAFLTEGLAPRQRERVRILSYPRNQGRGRALKTGIDAALGELIVTTEADGSWGDDIVERLVQALDADPALDFVVASPHLPGGGLIHVDLGRVLLTRFGNLLIRLLFDSQVTMNTGMTRAYRARVIQPLVVYENGKEFHLEVLLKLLTIGFRVGEIPAVITWQRRRRRARGVAVRRSSTKILKTIGTHLRFVAIAQPVRYFAAASAISLAVGSGFLGSAIYMLATHGPAVFLALIGLLMFLFTLLFAGFSVMFYQFREFLREQWTLYYPAPRPPFARAGRAVLGFLGAAGRGRGSAER